MWRKDQPGDGGPDGSCRDGEECGKGTGGRTLRKDRWEGVVGAVYPRDPSRSCNAPEAGRGMAVSWSKDHGGPRDGDGAPHTHTCREVGGARDLLPRAWKVA